LELLGLFDEWDEALSEAGRYADEHMDRTLARKDRQWRNGAASEAQIKFARQLGTYKSGMSKGQVAQSITHGLVLRALKKNEVIK
jgi:hypothetical protein